MLIETMFMYIIITRIFSLTMFVIQSTVHTTSQHTLVQLVFSTDAILNINLEANWQSMKQFKHALINKGSQKENLHRESHIYYTGDNVLLKNPWNMRSNEDVYIGPYTFT